MMREGVVLAGLANSLKYKRCSLQNDVSLEDAKDIGITLTNNSNEILDIKELELLCRVCYKKKYNLIIKMEMKENLYPRLPTAPPIEDQGQGYHLKK